MSIHVDTPQVGPVSVTIAGTNPYAGLPRYDSRYSNRYARRLMAHAGMYEELDREMRRDGIDVRQDASLSVAFARALEYIIRTPYEAEYPELRAKEFIPLLTGVPPAANSFTYRMFNKIGVAAIISDSGNDAPKVDVEGKEWQQPIVTIGASYEYTILDSMRAAMANIPLESFKAEACRFAIEYLIENLAAVGNAGVGLVGLANAPSILSVTQQSTGGNWMKQIQAIGAAASTNATPPATVVAQAIAADINAMIAKIYTTTLGIHMPTNLLISTPAYIALKTTPARPQYSNDTLLSYLEELTGLEIDPWVQLNSAGATPTTDSNGVITKGRVIAYKKDPKLLNLVVSQPFTQLPPQPVKMAWEIMAYARTGAVQVRYPATVCTLDGVS